MKMYWTQNRLGLGPRAQIGVKLLFNGSVLDDGLHNQIALRDGVDTRRVAQARQRLLRRRRGVEVRILEAFLEFSFATDVSMAFWPFASTSLFKSTPTGLEARRRGDLGDAVAHEPEADDADRRDLLSIRVALGLVGLFRSLAMNALLLRRTLAVDGRFLFRGWKAFGTRRTLAVERLLDA